MAATGISLLPQIDWHSLSGVVLEGGCELTDVLEVRQEGARLRVRILGFGGRMGTAYFLRLDGQEAEDQLDIWETLRDAPHANLNRPISAGQRMVSGVPVIYFVLADPDEQLAAVVPERPLEWEEAAELLHSVEGGLAHLHAYGLVHGSVSPETVQAVGYTIFLDTESVRRIGTKPRVEWKKPLYLAPETDGANLTAAADVWCLGATLFEVLSQQRYGTAGAELERGLPLGGIIARCLDTNPATRCALKDASKAEPAPPPPVHTPPQREFRTLPPPPPEPETVRAAQTAVPVAAQAPASRSVEFETVAIPLPPPTTVETRAPSPAPRVANARSANAARLPHPLTPGLATPASRPATEELALVPLGKRAKKLDPKRPGGIKGFFHSADPFPTDTADSGLGEDLALRVPFKNRRIAIIASSVAILAAIWLLVLPKLEPVDTVVRRQTAQPLEISANGDSGSVTTPVIGAANSPQTPLPLPQNLPATPSLAAPGALDPTTAVQPSAQPATTPSADPSTPDTSTATSPAPKPDLFRLAVSFVDTREAAMQRADALTQQHPDLIFRIARNPTEEDPNHFMVVVGGILRRNEADDLSKRLVEKGVTTGQIVAYKKPLVVNP